MRTLSVAVLAALVLTVSGCGSGDAGNFLPDPHRVTDADRAGCRTEKAVVAAALEAYYAEHEKYPPSIAALVARGFLHADPSLPSVEETARITGYDAATGTFTPGTACR
ncbi:MAG: hypothetical protein ACJ72E_04295 [Marmoricola sp.]